jgi:hypothetical protein
MQTLKIYVEESLNYTLDKPEYSGQVITDLGMYICCFHHQDPSLVSCSDFKIMHALFQNLLLFQRDAATAIGNALGASIPVIVNDVVQEPALILLAMREASEAAKGTISSFQDI